MWEANKQNLNKIMKAKPDIIKYEVKEVKDEIKKDIYLSKPKVIKILYIGNEK